MFSEDCMNKNYAMLLICMSGLCTAYEVKFSDKIIVDTPLVERIVSPETTAGEGKNIIIECYKLTTRDKKETYVTGTVAYHKYPERDVYQKNAKTGAKCFELLEALKVASKDSPVELTITNPGTYKEIIEASILYK